jgi:hypothetical protein
MKERDLLQHPAVGEKIILKEIERRGVCWVQPAQDWDQRLAVVNIAAEFPLATTICYCYRNSLD